MKSSLIRSPNFLEEKGVQMEFTIPKKLNESLKTYLFITGTDSRNVQELLGHFSIPIPIGKNSCKPEKSSKNQESI